MHPDLRRRCLRLLVAGAALVLVAACSKPSRFDDATVVDVCALVDKADVARVLGPPLETPAPEATGGGFAGSCAWSFKAFRSQQAGRLSAYLMTRASAGVGLAPSRFFAMSQDEVRVSLGAAPWAMKDLGDVANLYQTRDPNHSELWLKQAETVVIMRMTGGSAAQLEEMARLVARELAPKKTPAAA